MEVNLDSRARATSENASSVPGEPAEVRKLIQERIAIYLGVSFALWALAVLVDVVMGRLDPDYVSEDFISRTAIVVGLGIAWGWVRRGEHSATQMQRVEVAATLFEITGFVVTCSAYLAWWRPNMNMLLGVSAVLVLRAAVVPSTPRRVLAVGAVAHVPVLAATWYVFRRDGALPNGPTISSEMVWTCTWTVISLVSTTVIAWVIYGLRQRVAAAMKLGQYTLLDKLGEGGMGAVYRARHALLRRTTAVKVMQATEDTHLHLARFEREVQLLSEISHPHIVSVYDFGRSPDGAFYYAMEYLEGVDLQRIVERDGPMPPARVAHVLAQIAEALAEAHAFGLIHRDIKPSNIVLCDHLRRPDHVKVVDFGLAKQIDRAADPTVSNPNVIAGTPLYMAPESITSSEAVDARTDLYSLGAVGYFLLTGEPVFPGKTAFEVCARALHQAVEAPSARLGAPLPPKLEALVLKCLAKSQDDRPKSALDFLEALRACDDVPAWTFAESRRWWDERDDTVQGERIHVRESAAGTRTLMIAPRTPHPVNRASA